MKKLLVILLGTTVMMGSTSLMAGGCKNKHINNLTLEIPLIEYTNDNWQKVPDVAHYGDADWSNVVGRVENISVKEAMEIAESHAEITYFFFLKGGRMVLGNKPNLRIFNHGDAVFFKGEPVWGEAKYLADGYVKKPAV